jgi:hypothetical protein
MPSGTKNNPQLDPLTAWELAAINVLIALHPDENLDVKASRENMLMLMQALDRGELVPILADPIFMEQTEALLLAMLQGKRIEVRDSSTFEARQEIFAAAQVIYNQAIARGLWELHPKIRQAMQKQK